MLSIFPGWARTETVPNLVLFYFGWAGPACKSESHPMLWSGYSNLWLASEQRTEKVWIINVQQYYNQTARSRKCWRTTHTLSLCETKESSCKGALREGSLRGDRQFDIVLRFYIISSVHVEPGVRSCRCSGDPLTANTRPDKLGDQLTAAEFSSSLSLVRSNGTLWDELHLSKSS